LGGGGGGKKEGKRGLGALDWGSRGGEDFFQGEVWGWGKRGGLGSYAWGGMDRGGGEPVGDEARDHWTENKQYCCVLGAEPIRL